MYLVIASLSAEKWKLEGCASPAFTYYILPPVTFELQRHLTYLSLHNDFCASDILTFY